MGNIMWGIVITGTIGVSMVVGGIYFVIAGLISIITGREMD